MAADEKASAAREVNHYSKEKREPLATSRNDAAKPGITFAAQDKLPRLPIPELHATLKKYLDALEPLQSHQDHVETERVIEEFLKRDGPELQHKLTSYAGDKSSYIEQFCRCCIHSCGSGLT